MTAPPRDLLRDLAPRVLGAVVRRYGNFPLAEDAVQEALLAAATRWAGEGVPGHPLGWLVTVASRRFTDLVRADRARRRREETVARWTPPPPGPAGDDSLVLLLMCCHPALTPASRIALTLRAVGGLTTGEIARAFLVSEATMTRRITRAKQAVRDSGAHFTMPAGDEWDERLAAVLRVLYLIFNEGYVSTSGRGLQRTELSDEAIRLARMLHRLLPADGEAGGLLALMLLTDARRAARTGPDGLPVPMVDQDRALWDTARIAEGAYVLADALPRPGLGPYRLQAAIAAVHDEAAAPEDTDWPRIVSLYEVLMSIEDTPVVRMNHAVAVAMAIGPAAGLKLLDDLPGLDADHRYHAARAHLLEKTGEFTDAHDTYLRAAELTGNLAQRRFLRARAARWAA